MTEENLLPDDQTKTIPGIEKEILDGDQNKSELATDLTPDEGAEKKFNQEDLNKAVNKQHFKFREEERGHKETQRLLDEAKARLAESNKTTRPVVPRMPDQFDDDYEQKIKIRDKTISDQGAYDQQQQFLFNQQQENLNQRQFEAAKVADETVKGFQARATELKIDHNKLIESENIVGQYIQDRNVAMFLLADKDGPQMVNYLAANPVELEKVATMTPMNAALYLRNDISKAALKNNQSQAPDPGDDLGGRSTIKVEDPAIAGATFE